MGLLCARLGFVVRLVLCAGAGVRLLSDNYLISFRQYHGVTVGMMHMALFWALSALITCLYNPYYGIGTIGTATNAFI